MSAIRVAIVDRKHLSQVYSGNHELMRWHEQVSLAIAASVEAQGGSGQAALPTGGTSGDVLLRTSQGAQWGPQASGLPVGGATGQVLTKASLGAVWATPAAVSGSGSASQFDLGDSGPSGGVWFDFGLAA